MRVSLIVNGATRRWESVRHPIRLSHAQVVVSLFLRLAWLCLPPHLSQHWESFGECFGVGAGGQIEHANPGDVSPAEPAATLEPRSALVAEVH